MFNCYSEHWDHLKAWNSTKIDIFSLVLPVHIPTHFSSTGHMLWAKSFESIWHHNYDFPTQSSHKQILIWRPVMLHRPPDMSRWRTGQTTLTGLKCSVVYPTLTRGGLHLYKHLPFHKHAGFGSEPENERIISLDKHRALPRPRLALKCFGANASAHADGIAVSLFKTLRSVGLSLQWAIWKVSNLHSQVLFHPPTCFCLCRPMSLWQRLNTTLVKHPTWLRL